MNVYFLIMIDRIYNDKGLDEATKKKTLLSHASKEQQAKLQKLDSNKIYEALKSGDAEVTSDEPPSVEPEPVI